MDRARAGRPFSASEETLLLGRPLNKPGPAQQDWAKSLPTLFSLPTMAGLHPGPKAHC